MHELAFGIVICFGSEGLVHHSMLDLLLLNLMHVIFSLLVNLT